MPKNKKIKLDSELGWKKSVMTRKGRSRSPIKPGEVKNKRANKGNSRASSVRSVGSSHSSIPTKNQFQILQQDTNMQIDMDSESVQPTNVNKSKSSGYTVKNTKTLKAVKPIVFKMENHKFEDIKKIISETKLMDTCSLKKNFEGNIQIQTKSVEDKNTVIDCLKKLNQNKNNEYQFYTYTENCDKLKTFVLKGFIFMKTEELIQILKDEGISAEKVSFLNNSETNPSYLVQFEKASQMDISKLKTQFKVIDLVVVVWQKFNKSKKKYTQCHRCQQFGHVARNCNQQYRCVKCISDHGPGECTKKRNQDLPQCFNCKEMHPANSRDCKSFLDYKSRLESLKNPKKPSKSNPPKTFKSSPAPWENFSQYEKNFPTLSTSNLKERLDNNSFNNNYTKSNNTNDDFSTLNSEFCNIPNIKETLKRYKELIAKLKGTNCHGARLAIIIEYTTPDNE